MNKHIVSFIRSILIAQVFTFVLPCFPVHAMETKMRERVCSSKTETPELAFDFSGISVQDMYGLFRRLLINRSIMHTYLLGKFGKESGSSSADLVARDHVLENLLEQDDTITQTLSPQAQDAWDEFEQRLGSQSSGLTMTSVKMLLLASAEFAKLSQAFYKEPYRLVEYLGPKKEMLQKHMIEIECDASKAEKRALGTIFMKLSAFVQKKPLFALSARASAGVAALKFLDCQPISLDILKQVVGQSVSSISPFEDTIRDFRSISRVITKNMSPIASQEVRGVLRECLDRIEQAVHVVARFQDVYMNMHGRFLELQTIFPELYAQSSAVHEQYNFLYQIFYQMLRKASSELSSQARNEFSHAPQAIFVLETLPLQSVQGACDCLRSFIGQIPQAIRKKPETKKRETKALMKVRRTARRECPLARGQSPESMVLRMLETLGLDESSETSMSDSALITWQRSPLFRGKRVNKCMKEMAMCLRSVNAVICQNSELSDEVSCLAHAARSLLRYFVERVLQKSSQTQETVLVPRDTRDRSRQTKKQRAKRSGRRGRRKKVRKKRAPRREVKEERDILSDSSGNSLSEEETQKERASRVHEREQVSVEQSRGRNRRSFTDITKDVFRFFCIDRVITHVRNAFLVLSKMWDRGSFDDGMTALFYLTEEENRAPEQAQISLDVNSKKRLCDRFHQIPKNINMLLRNGIYVSSQHVLSQTACLQHLRHPVSFNSSCYAIVFPGKIGSRFAYNWRIFQNPGAYHDNYSHVGVFHGVWVFIFSKSDNQCFHACFHEYAPA